MNTKELFIEKDGQYISAGVYACGECKIIHREKEWTERCCSPTLCNVCNQPSGRKHYTLCIPCGKIQAAQKEKEKFDKATKVKASEYTQPVMSVTDDWYETVEELVEYYEDEGEAAPAKYCWGTTEFRPTYDAESIIEHQQAYEGWEDQLDDVEGLQKLLDDWCAKQPSWWEADWTVAVMLDE